jgi:hypothetical protein
MEMEIKESYQEVVHMLEGVLLHIFRGIKGTPSLAVSLTWEGNVS